MPTLALLLLKLECSYLYLVPTASKTLDQTETRLGIRATQRVK